MWPMCSANNPLWLLIPFLVGLWTAWWAWGHLRNAEQPNRRRRRSSQRLQKARRAMGDPYAHLVPPAPPAPEPAVEHQGAAEPFPPSQPLSLAQHPLPDHPVAAALTDAPQRQEYFQKGAEAVAQKSQEIRAVSARVGADDLLRIKGIGPSLNAMLIALGITRFDQIAHWTAAQIAEVDSHLGAFSGRIHRENWVEQARLLASDQLEEFEKRFGGAT